ncbi:MAG: tRNA (N6-isopentenyl adenosine(37)-C2)-methylthiotransferase MiaB [Bacteroidota bacterium]
MEQPKNVYIETYGCQMNVADSEIVASVMRSAGCVLTQDISVADIILVNTCSVRDHAEQRVLNRLMHMYAMRRKRPKLIIGLIGCMAERLKDQLLEEDISVDLIAGPDAYRELPQLVAAVSHGQKAAGETLPGSETYSDISPVRYDTNGVSAFITIMRGCENFCTYCVVPYTRGAERSRPPETILREVKEAFEQGYKEVTLLGQNVNSYRFSSEGVEWNFSNIIEEVALVNPLLRVRFFTSHPKDLSDGLLEVMAKHANICRHVHLPLQSGSDKILERMNRKYTRAWFLERVTSIRKYLPDCAITTDIISGFCGETEEDHLDTLNMMETVKFDHGFFFKYSERPGTAAAGNFKDDVDEETKNRRLNEVISLQQRLARECNQPDVGKTVEILLEGSSKKSGKQLFGRTSQNKAVVFEAAGRDLKAGDYVMIKVTDCSSSTLKGNLQ